MANCSTPANYFHILRRQLHRPFRKPLILMTPKSLLRHKKAVSKLSELAEGSSFHRVLWDDAQHDNGHTTIKLKSDDQIRRVILCSGKVYYDLLDDREKKGVDDRLHPAPGAVLSLADEVPDHRTGPVQERRAGVVPGRAQEHGRLVLRRSVGRADPRQDEIKAKRARYVGRPASASTAAGLMSRHLKELNAFLDEAFAA